MAQGIAHEIEYDNVVLNVTGFYAPEEREVMYNEDLGGYPGAPAYFDIHTILCGGQDIIGILHYETIQEIEKEILNNIYNHEY